ncbi:hypothetical protein BKA67DRAFT_623725 [Truncatella angustata]|uniref:Anaphase-promoting complex subunit 1 N-terminal domain-containing protein n=1 Tax=Truncatella angustata TaxID=152316 RepID=A0A9P8ZXW0_9PEZI|nr:uncharacterized protein BKA67DRAFT_623725 [Truncatella angustata]KAH6654528.1 hypothetical protein BKA67DRAFT_623725 [Truncatella angustata]
MAAVTSLGLHQPTALQYAIQEQLIDEHAPKPEYTWHTFVSHDGDHVGEDELLVTKEAVIWSRGNIFRKCFGFKLEKEPVTQALLTYFPTSDQSSHHSPRHGSQSKLSFDRRILSKALVVFLKTQAHIYFLDGTSHVVHMPFEVESACAAPQGVIIQRKPRNDVGSASSLKFPRVPPNSFISPQTSPVSMRNSQQSTFTTDTLGRPKALPLRLTHQGENIWEVPNEKEDSHWPRLVSLTDPLLDMGLVVTHADKPAKLKNRRVSSKQPCFLDRAEEILHIEEIMVAEPTMQERSEPLVLAITINRESSMYTVWRFTYLKREDPFRAPKSTKKTGDRRRSSMQPGLPSGVASPTQPSFQESFGATLPGKRTRKSEKQEKVAKALENLESSLGLDKDAAAGRRTSRRVSSMLARADLSASQDRTAFGDQPQVANHTSGRRETSYGSNRARTSGVFAGASFGGTVMQSANTLGSFLEAPVDNLLEELRAGGDFEGFHNMGLDDHDFDGMAREIMFTKVHSVPVDNSNVRYSLSRVPAKEHCKVFCLTGSPSLEDVQNRRQVLVGFQDSMEKRLQLLTLYLQTPAKTSTAGPESVSITFGQLWKVQNVIDCCKLVDKTVSTILVLSEGANGTRELSLQAPWSELTSVSLPSKLSLSNVRSLDERGGLVDREVGLRRAITPSVGELAGIRHPKLNGVVDILDGETHQLHQIRIQLQPTRPQVVKIFNVLRAVLPSSIGDRLLAGWWHIMVWLGTQTLDVADPEWSAFVIQLLGIFMALGTNELVTAVSGPIGHRRNRSLLRSSSGAQVDLSDWDAMNIFEKPNSTAHPYWIDNRSWQWAVEEEDAASNMFHPSQGRQDDMSFMVAHLKYARSFRASSSGESAYGPSGFAPTTEVNSESKRLSCAQDILMALHWLLEEQKLDISAYHLTPPGSVDLRILVLQIVKWLHWTHWSTVYELELPFGPSDVHDSLANVVIPKSVPEPRLWSVLEWIQDSLTQAESTANSLPYQISALTVDILPQTKLFERFFEALKTRRQGPIEFVEAMHDSGVTPHVLESLPDTILVPLRDAISRCQARPPPTWSRSLLELVDRADVGSVLLPLDGSQQHCSSLAASSHLSSWDFSSLCQNVMDFNDAPADDTAESDKQSVIRAIFKEDRRLEETKLMLNTTRPRGFRLDPQPEWSEPFYLEQQKEHVTRLATNTLSIPAGRGLMNYGLRFPLLTQKYHINGFVLNCVVKPTNVTVGVDKNLFTEDKIAWAFFHSGVAAGLSISRQAKGVDTSWILYNKPGHDLNNRHAGFLLALGLNGHLKGLAKWVAFKYLTPKHTMTSIGLLLGLAASYIGTMDSLITRLLSVHVTRMLPRGAAELNLSPLTQTTGIMGIGLLYCNSQHRRMSEIMMSEIKHVETEDDEEPLRSECYRLAAGFALGYINLGKGTDLKGLHDMRITEQLLTLASSTKNTELVHVLDRSSAAAVMAIALIYMKSEDHIVARKIDVPDAVLQFDYIRPDILLLRTVAKHLILWSEIKPTHNWIRKNLPARYHSRVNPPTQSFDDSHRGPLNTTHLPFLTILAGLCWAVALRHAGSGDTRARDLLLVYLQRFYGYCRSAPVKANFDDRTVHVTARMCLDVVALSAATVMAGTCDLKVLRILRSLHGRNDTETTYGSHMATHMAIGVLALGCGTQTFSTSNMAIASLLVAFYPDFPDQVQDNKSHLQAFRHFWVLATDSRCLVTKDVSTNTPISVSIIIKFKGGRPEEVRNTPCLLPPLADIVNVRTNSPEFWNLEMDFSGPAGSETRQKFEKNQALYLRRRPAGGDPFSATMLALGRQAVSTAEDQLQPLEWLFDAASTLRRLTHAERDITLDSAVGGPDVSLSRGSAVDARLVLEESLTTGRRDDLIGLKGLFEWLEWKAKKVEKDKQEKTEGTAWNNEGWLRESIIEGLKGKVWLAAREDN